MRGEGGREGDREGMTVARDIEMNQCFMTGTDIDEYIFLRSFDCVGADSVSLV